MASSKPTEFSDVGALSSRQREAWRALQAFQQRHERPPTRAELGRVLGVSAQTADFHLKALQRKGYVRLSRLSRGIDLLVSDGGTAATTPGAVRVAEVGAHFQAEAASVRQVPVLGRVAAGAPLLALENIDGSLPLPAGSQADFALRVEGESMIEAGILDGDLVLVQKTNQARSGDIVVALIGEGETTEATVKRYVPQRGRVVLRPANATMADIVVRQGEALTLAGRVVGVLRLWG
jgi:repressor LexA